MLSQMNAALRNDVVRIAVEIGVASDLFDGWDGGELALYPDEGGRSASLDVALEIAREKARRGDWIVDIGNRAFALPKPQGIALRAKLDALGIGYETGPQAEPFLKRTRWAVREHAGVLAELAKR